MGTYFNPSNGGFRKTASDEIYVDKSGLLNILNRKIGAERNCISVSHARRFGKSQTVRMIDTLQQRVRFKRVVLKSENFVLKQIEKYSIFNLMMFTISNQIS